MSAGDEIIHYMNKAGQYRLERDEARQRIAELEAAVAVKDAALRQVETVEGSYGFMDCLWCGESPELGGHADDCPRQAALSGDAGKRLLEAAKAVLYHDERGQGVGYNEAMETLRGILEAE